ncbi:MAG TPA: restriction endonuclease [Chloroflexia bacterium]|nr:restriction endonuclease [Chloroflexia bacterium]
MQLVASYHLQTNEPVVSSALWQEIQNQIKTAVEAIVWPPGNTVFAINPTKHGNGVSPIKQAFLETLVGFGWQTKQVSIFNVGAVDAVFKTESGIFAVEWETGNISSSHRSLNRLSLGLYNKTLVGGILVLPSRSLYNHLTDRIGNLRELQPYFPLYQLLPLNHGVLTVIEIEHDKEDPSLPLISKMTDGFALIAKSKQNS